MPTYIPPIVSILEDLDSRRIYFARNRLCLIEACQKLATCEPQRAVEFQQEVNGWTKTLLNDEARFAELCADFIRTYGPQLHAIFAAYPRLLASHADYVQSQEKKLGDPNLEWSKEIHESAREAWSDF